MVLMTHEVDLIGVDPLALQDVVEGDHAISPMISGVQHGVR